MTVRRLFVIIFALILLYKPVRPTLDPDLGWHLRTGDYILTHGLPRYDVLSFTVPDHRWITHEWLSDVSMMLIYRLGGYTALMLVFAGIIALSFWLMYRRCVGQPYLAAFVTLLGAFTSGLTWGARPQMFNMLLVALFAFIVEGVKDKQLDRRGLWVLPPLTAVWANLHSGYLVGVALLGAYTLGEWLQKRFGAPDERQLDGPTVRRLALITALCFGAAVVNPNGYHLWVFPLETLTSSAIQAYIEEWYSPNFHASGYWPFGLMLAVGSLSIVFSKRRPTWTDLLLFFGTGAAGLISSRHIQLFAVVTIPVISRHALTLFSKSRFYFLISGTQPAPAPTRRLVILHWLALGILGLVGVFDIARTIQTNDAAMRATFPAAAVDWIEAQGWRERRMFNNYNWGGYLVWRGLPVFIDGRAEVYGDAFILRYLDTIFVRPNWREMLNDFDVEFALIGRESPLSTVMLESGEWREVYRDDMAVILTRASP